MSGISTSRHHADWLSLVEVSGPFLSLPVLLKTFPQGLEPRDATQAKALRAAYEEWQDNRTAPSKQRSWILHVLTELLGYPAELVVEGQTLPAGLEAVMAEIGETLRPDFALVGPAGSETAGKAQLLIASYAPEQGLDRPVTGRHWKANPATRMMELLHASGVPLGLVTNGEHWMLVFAPRGETTGYASWYGALWLDEPITLRAFHSLLGARRFFGVAAESTLLGMLNESAQDQQEVTDQLGYQVRGAVEVLVQAFDVLDRDSNRTLLNGVSETVLYEAALTVMMRLVFLFSAEERGLLHLGKPLYDDNYAISTLLEQLQEVADQQGEEILERRSDAWARLLATFRAVHGGVHHQDLLMPAYGGSLFDPDRYPFLEGRGAGTTWAGTDAEPLAVNNRVALHLLTSLQKLRIKVPGGGPSEARRISFRALGVEQIGHVYEGLLDHTAARATGPVLGIRGTRDKEPEIPLTTLEANLAQGQDKLIEFLKEETGRSTPALKRAMEEDSPYDEHRLLIACGQDRQLLQAIRPFAGMLREDSFERPTVILPGSVYVTSGTTRRSTGTHYTPPSLTQPIVQYTLEPLVYEGPAEGLLREDWQLKPPKEILDLKVCDMAMGSGAFLVQACRYLSERLVEAWENEEKKHPHAALITPEGRFSQGTTSERLLPQDSAERLAIARRIVADRCLYGVDINPMAVEMAKLSLWLITLDSKRPFTFLDHAFKCGDSLLGLTSFEQLVNFSLRPEGAKQIAFGTMNLGRHVDEAKEKRKLLELMPSDTPEQVAAKAALYDEAEAATARVKALADILVAFELRDLAGELYFSERAVAAEQAEVEIQKPLNEFRAYAHAQLKGRRAFHWSIEFPEVAEHGGFNAFLFNPPFRSGSRISTDTSPEYFRFIKMQFPASEGNTDLCCYFIHRASLLLDRNLSTFGFLATNSISQGDNRASTLMPLQRSGWTTCTAFPDIIWPGTANLFVSWVVLVCQSFSRCQACLSGRLVEAIDSNLSEAAESREAYALSENEGIAYKGVEFLGDGFKLDDATAQTLLARYANDGVIRPWLNGADLTDRSYPSRHYAIDFADMSMVDAQQFPECFSIVEREVKPVRAGDNRAARRERWWQFGEKAMGMRAALGGLNKALVRPFTSDTFFFRFMPTEFMFTNALIVICRDDMGTYAVLNSSIHEVWARQQGSSLKLDFRYTPSKCFTTYPFPRLDARSFAEVADHGQRMDIYREELMNRNNFGLTPLYNLFHTPGQSKEIADLRELHMELDKAVVAAYDWKGLDLGHGFHETKQGLRYTVSEGARREILTRLLALNHRRHAEEETERLKLDAETKPTRKGTRKVKKSDSSNDVSDLFDLGEAKQV